MSMFRWIGTTGPGRYGEACGMRRFTVGPGDGAGSGYGGGSGRGGSGRGGRAGGHGQFGGGGGRFGRDGRLRRLLEHGDLRMLVLHLIAEKPRHGYEIIKAIEDLAGGAYAPSPGVVYPTLTMLEEIGQIIGETEGARKRFTITPIGATALAENQVAVNAILARIAQAQAQEPALPVLRALENLKTTLRLKLAAGLTTPDVARRIADTIDQAARSIEDL